MRPRCCRNDPAPRQGPRHARAEGSPRLCAHVGETTDGKIIKPQIKPGWPWSVMNCTRNMGGFLTQVPSNSSITAEGKPSSSVRAPRLPAGFYPQQSQVGTERFCPTAIPVPGRTGKTAPLCIGKPGQKPSRAEGVTLPKMISS